MNLSEISLDAIRWGANLNEWGNDSKEDQQAITGGYNYSGVKWKTQK